MGVVVTAGAITLFWGGTVLFRSWTDRATYDVTILQRVAGAVEAARHSPALEYAPEALGRSEASYREGLALMRREDTRFFLFRDYRLALGALDRAEKLAREAEAAGSTARSGARSSAEAILARAGEFLALLDELEAQTKLGRVQQAGLSGARLGFVEASSLLEAGAFREAAARGQVSLERARAVLQGVGDAVLRFADQERVGTWKRWIDETVAWSRENRTVALVVVKERSLVLVYRNGRKVAEYSADMGMNNLAQKYRRGDQATPEGRYKVKEVRDQGRTQYYRAFLLDYPTPEDLRRIQAAKERGIIPADAGPGALIEIHGEGGRGVNWTNGCVAVSNADMDELFELVRVGTPVTIVGGDGSDGTFSSLAERLSRGRDN